MTRKKVITPIEAPVTLEEWGQFIEIWTRLQPVLEELAPATSFEISERYSGWAQLEYQNAHGYKNASEEGIEFTYKYRDPYDDYDSISTKLIPIEAILNPQTHMDNLDEARKYVEKSRSKHEKENELATYERLKAKFEK